MAGHTLTTKRSRQAVSELVRGFYEQMPFNYSCSALEAAERVADNPIEAYPDLDRLLRGDGIKQVLEIGCGAGWVANAIALHYAKDVTALDLAAAALERAWEVSRRLGTAHKIAFVHGDLFEFRPRETFDLVLSIGVLHHTFDCRRAFEHICRFVAEDGFVFLGLYHLYGRRAFLGLFQEILASEGEEAAFLRYAELNPDLQDETHLRSWFRDQVLHPQETQHTLGEVLDWLDDNGFALVTTSINRYGDVGNRKSLIEQEIAYEALSERRNRVEGSFFPGFFTILARRTR